MSRFDLDYQHLSRATGKQPIRYADVAHKMVKVSFDLVRFHDAPTDELWQIQDSDDGTPVIVALYDEDEQAKTAGNWSVRINKTAGSIDVFYRQAHITKIPAVEIGIDADDVDTLGRSLPRRLAGDKSLSEALLSDLPAEERARLTKLYPELG